jgi:hypothetical protein
MGNDVPEDQRTESVELTVTWRSKHTINVTEGQAADLPADLDGVMALVEADPDIDDITPDHTAEIVDWDW